MLSNPGQKVEADRVSRITQMIEIGKGVCRHQAVLMVTLLKRFGFDAHQVWHNFDDGSSHTLAFVNDPDIKAFVHPVKQGNSAAFIPYNQYELFWGKKTTKWRNYVGSGNWSDLNWNFHMK